MSRVWPARVTLPTSRAFSRSAVLSFAMAALTSPKALLPLNLGPRTGRLGSASRRTYFSTLASWRMASTFTSSRTYCRKGPRPSKTAALRLTTVRAVMGCFTDTFFCSRSLRAISTTAMKLLICSQTAASSRRSLTSAMRRWWMEASARTLPVRRTRRMFWNMSSVMKGTCGESSTFTLNRTSNSTFRLTSQLSSSTSPLRRLRLRRTYQLVSA